MNYLIQILIFLQIYIILSLSLNLKVGFTGLLSLCHAAYYGTGAYTASLLMVNYGYGFFSSLFIAIVLYSTVFILMSLHLQEYYRGVGAGVGFFDGLLLGLDVGDDEGCSVG